MKEALALITSLQNAKGTNAKQDVIRLGSQNTYFKRLLIYALDPYLTYKVSERSLRKPWQYDPAITLTMTDFFEVCDRLAGIKAMDDATMYQLRGFLEAHEEDVCRIYTQILCKTLRLGVTAKTVNKVIPGLIPEWEVQQAYPIEKHPLKPDVWFSLSISQVSLSA